MACDIIVRFYIVSLLKYDRILCKNLNHDTYVVKYEVFDPALFRVESVQCFLPEIYASFPVA